MKVAHNRALDEGSLELELVSNPTAAEIPALLQRGFAVEDQSWKGAEGTSTLRSPGAFRYFVEQATLLAASGHLLLVFLNLDGRSIAFEYGWLSKGIYHSLKVGYDQAFSRLSPGQLLRYLLMQHFFATGEVLLVDYLGPLAEATSKWTTSTYPVCRLWMAQGALGRLLLWGYRQRQRRHPHPASPSLLLAPGELPTFPKTPAMLP